MKLLAIPIIAVSLVAGVSAQQAKDDNELIQGSWKVISIHRRGKELDKEEVVGGIFAFKDGKIVVTVGGKTQEGLAYKLDPSKNPRWINITSGDKTYLGIYELDGDTMRICHSDRKRPTKLVSEPEGPETYLYVYKRETSRDKQFKAMLDDFQAALADLQKAARDGKIKVPDYALRSVTYLGPRLPAEFIELRKRTAKRTRELIDADPKDEVALDAILFSIYALWVDRSDSRLYELLLVHHLASPKLGDVVGPSGYLREDRFLQTVAAKSPHAMVRGEATFALAKRQARAARSREAEALCEQILKDQELAKHHRLAAHLLFELRHLSVGKVVPEVEGVDLDDKPMKLSEYRGKAVMLVFWATWASGSMKMVPHEQELAKRYAGRPFALVGINGDRGEEGEASAKKAVESQKITWRSFRNSLLIKELHSRWNISWPTVFLVDHEGVIRHVFRGVTEDTEKELDAAVEKLVAAADQKKPDKK